PLRYYGRGMGRMLEPLSDVRRWADDRRLIIDVLFVAVLATVGALDVAGSDPDLGERDPDALAYALILVGAFALLWRRYAPEVTLIVVFLVMMLFWAREYPAFLSMLGLPALYAVAVHGLNRRRAWITIGLACAALMAVARITILDEPEGFSYPNALSMAAYLAAGVAVGLVIRNRDRIFVDTERRAAQAEADRDIEARRAVAEERGRIAREMHDVVAHGMSGIAVQAAAAQGIVHTDADRTAALLTRIETMARESLTEMRRMVGVLRDQDDRVASLAPQARLRDISETVAQSVDAGTPTELVISGEQRDLPPGIELAGFRIVQEALTNVRKHAGPSASATVHVAYGPTALALEVIDDGRGPASSLSQTGAGNGLLGMRERVEIYGGGFTAGPLPDGGYSVSVTLPITDAATRPSVRSASPIAETSP
ncbi:MAG: sensor histidine kinase, partial [Acidimicrobiales bacterium]